MWDNAPLLNRVANLLIAAALLAVLGVIALYIARLPAFAVREVEVTGQLEHVTAEQIHAVARHAVRGTFFTLDLELTRHQFEKLPWVRRVEVRRQWPARLELQVEEQTALARWGDTALVNTFGEVFEAATDDETLPTFAGPLGQADEMAQQYQRFTGQLAPLERRIARLTLSARAAWQLQLDDGLTLELGRSDMEARLARFVTVYDRTIGRLPPSVVHVDLRYANGFAIRLPEARGRDGKSKG
ncbi:MAG TPA: cell division protein FtsQ/DivIB [Burkholderiales bacterium]|nr:cell division protein FtsQ/DivIB [Burkholderiales bacterium]